ncbi:MAG TPA: alpha/beta fold hydrolase [Dyella sp.]|uniref:alpha/beta fold hydrolase n=1 Tax=Dyella sp. TaxID=1869338 RepID=UPI002D79019E|nr:alpha/beta fold hydrolase [Dyella sp.]HET6553790.1 alpha/beta fold hydrolase [Dyella sp.]
MNTLRRFWAGKLAQRWFAGACARWVLLPLLIALLAGCGSDNTAANTTDPHWVKQASPPSRVAVVFVHGLFGDTDGSWTNANGTTFFQLLKSAPGVGNQVDVFAFGFTSNKLKGGSLDVREAANMLEQSLQYNGVWNYPTVVFVAHSMGGLIAMREMIDNPAHREKVPLMMFYATPQEGSQITAIAQHVVNNPAVKQMLMADENDFLKSLNDDWARIPDEDKPTINCAYETAPYTGVMIVPWSSATRYCKGVPTAIEGTDHLTIVKPDRLDHPSVVVLVNALNKYVFGAPNQAMLETPDFQPEGDHWSYELTDPNGRNDARLVNQGDRKLDYTIAQISDPILIVLPDDTPKAIPAHHRDDLKLVLMQGQLKNEYHFTLSVPPLGDRLIMVRIKDVAAVQAKQDGLVRDVTTQVSSYLASGDNVAALMRLPKDQQFATIANVAADSVAKTAPDLPPAAKWVVTADALASLGLLYPANTALRNAAQASPGIAAAPGPRLLASVISAESGKPDVLEAMERPVLPDGNGPVYADIQQRVVEIGKVGKPNSIDTADAHARADLSTRMQVVPSLKAYGYSMKGDVLWAQGDATAAKQAYQYASELQSTPITDKKLEAVKMDELNKLH